MTIRELLSNYQGTLYTYIDVRDDYVNPEKQPFSGELKDLPYFLLDKKIEWWAVLDDGLEIVII